MYQIPVLHPLVNHFAIALLIVAGGASVVWLIWGTSFWRNGTLLLLLTGFAGAWVAKITGEDMEHFSKGRAIVKELVHKHEDLANWTILISGLAVILLGGYCYRLWRKKLPSVRDGMPIRAAIAVLLIASAVLVGFTGHVGGTMTWGEPAGTQHATTQDSDND